MRWIVIVAAISLSGCNGLLGPSEAEKAEQAYSELKRNGASLAQLCRAAENVAYEYAAAENAEKQRQWDLYARIDCNSAALAMP